MNATRESLAHRLNRDCDCSCTDLQTLRERIDIVDTHPHLFSATPVFLDPAEAEGMRRIVAAVESVVRLEKYRLAVVERAPSIARMPQPAQGAFLGFDFHLTPAGPRLVEINTNAGGAFLNAAARDTQRACCPWAEKFFDDASTRSLEDELFRMLLREWRLARGERALRSVAIVDENPREQYLYPEFLLARRLLKARGIRTVIADPGALEIREDVLLADGEPVDLVYNRLTDFYLEKTDHAVMRAAFERDLAVLTPHPRAHALYSDKRNLEILSDGNALRTLGADEDTIAVLLAGVPLTLQVTPDSDHWWRERKDWFFKPRHGFGSRGAYRGDKLTRRVFGDITRGNYIAQQLTPPSERWRTVAAGRESFKVDVRCYAYEGNVQLMAARLYQGQTTNFRTAGGGFAPVFVIGAPQLANGAATG
jgi:hypothetical protein